MSISCKQFKDRPEEVKVLIVNSISNTKKGSKDWIKSVKNKHATFVQYNLFTTQVISKQPLRFILRPQVGTRM